MSFTKLDKDKVGEYRQADIVPVRYDASDHSRTAVDVPALEAEFQRSRAKAEAERSAMQEISAAGTARDSVEERLAKLRRLRDGGVLSTEEYEAQRQRILQSL